MKPTDSFQKTIEYYNHNALGYAYKIKDKIPQLQLQSFIGYLSPKSHVLEIGCAAGRDTRELQLAGFTTTGVDISAELLKIARQLDQTSTYLEMDARSLEFSDDTFDGVYAAASLIHLPTLKDVKAALTQIHRVLKPGGIFYLSVKKKIGSKQTESVSEERSDFQPRFFRYFTKNQISTLLGEHGFVILQTANRQSSRGKSVEWLDVYTRKS